MCGYMSKDGGTGLESRTATDEGALRKALGATVVVLEGQRNGAGGREGDRQ